MNEQLRSALFAEDGQNTFAIIDGASCEELLAKLDAFQPEYVCLYAGELEPDVEEVAPYLVSLPPEHPFTSWLLAALPGKPWGILARTPAALRAMRKHLRTFLLVKSPDGKSLYFRYYDPRVLTTYLPTTNAAERESVFGPVSSYICETAPHEFVLFCRRGAELEQQRILNGAS